MEFAKRLKHLREKNGLSQEELADAIEIPRSSITNYESEDNDRLPRNPRLQKIALFFGVSVDYLLGIDDTSYIDSSPEEIKDVISKFENIEEIIRDYYLIRFKQMYKDMEEYIRHERDVSENVFNQAFDHSQYDNFKTPEDVYDSLSFNFKIQYLQAIIYDAKLKKMSLEEYLNSFGVKYKVRTEDPTKSKDNIDTITLMLKRTHSFVQQIGRVNRLSPSKDKTDIDTDIVQIPIYGTIKAGYDHVAEQNIVGYKLAAKKDVTNGEYFYLIVKGDSMIDEGIREGMHVLVKKQNFVENGKIGVVIVNDDEATLKRVYYDGPNLILQAANKEVAPRVLSVGDVMIQGQVVSVTFDV